MLFKINTFHCFPLHIERSRKFYSFGMSGEFVIQHASFDNYNNDVLFLLITTGCGLSVQESN